MHSIYCLCLCNQAVDAVVEAVKGMGRGLNPIAEDKVVRVPIPKCVKQPLTESVFRCACSRGHAYGHCPVYRMSKEMRDNLVKLAKTATEKCKVGIRRARQRGINEARKAKGEVSEDDIKRTEKQV